MEKESSPKKCDSTLLVSVITATYNSEATIKQAIESVLNQSYGNIEYIIADGKSTDRTIEIAESYRQQFSEKGYMYKIISEKDSGIYSGINKGISASNGVIVGNVNSDDYYNEKIVENAVMRYKEEKFDLFYADLNIVDKKGKVIRIKKVRKMNNLVTTRYWNHPTMFVSRRIYQKRLYDESFKYYADFDLTLWLYRHSKRITVINQTLSNFRLGGMSTQRNLKKSIEKAKERYRAYRNNGYSRIYLFECLFMDVGKDIVMRILENEENCENITYK